MRAGQAADPPTVAPGDALDLANHPAIIFQVFGEADDPRMIPIATVAGDSLRTVELDSAGWRRFDATYFRAGKSYPLFRNGRTLGTVQVRQGMWERPDDPLYALPGCRTLTPLAAVEIDREVKTDFTVEFLATTPEFAETVAAKPSAQQQPKPPSQQQVLKLARQLGYEAGKAAGLGNALVDSLNVHAVAVPTGLARAPTLLASFIDRASEAANAGTVRAVHMFVIADADSADSYRVTYVHRVNGPLTTAEFRRFYDHVDLVGGPPDEIILEGWRFGADTFLSVLRFSDGKWRQAFRSRPNWCLDERQEP